LFSSVCSVVIGLSIFVAIVTVFCIFRITRMCRKLKKQNKEEKMKIPAHSVVYTSANVQNGIEESFQLEEPTCKVQIENGAIDHNGIDSIQTVESAYVTAENHRLQETSL